MKTWRVLDACCCAGGATKGFVRALGERNVHVTGVDINPQPHYCGDEFVQGDAVAFIREHGRKFDFIHASPPCQAFTLAQRIQKREHPDLVGPIREALIETGRPYSIENVVGAPLVNPVMLCGATFPRLRVYRHRLFETSFPVRQPAHPEHVASLTKMGRAPQPDQFMHVVGNFSGVKQARIAMDIDWMTRDELRESIPPAYTQYIAEQYLLSAVREAA